MGKSVRDPLQPTDFFSAIGAKTTENPFAKSTTKETTSQGNFSAKDYKNLRNPSPFDSIDDLQTINNASQSGGELLANTAIQFNANLISSIGQGLANTFDLMALGKTAKGYVTGGADDFQSSLFGITTGEMQAWANRIAKNNSILEKKEGSVDFSDMGWWGKQIASAGTGVGMAIEALGTTIAIEYATGGMGTAAALAKLGSTAKKILTLGKGAEILHESVAAAKGMKSAATVYGIMSRTSEGRMEAMNSYDEIYNELSQETKKDAFGNTVQKYTEEEKQRYASEGARRTFKYNMALLPLDILGYRAMVYNPISGAAEGLLERGLAKIGNKALRKGVGYGIEAGSEMLEEGGQSVISNEGKHYARVLSGTDDGSTFLQRLGEDVKTDDFWNNALGGLIGSPVIGGAMKVADKVMNDNKSKRLDNLHEFYMKNVGKMDDVLATKIRAAEESGNTRTASIARRQFNANKALAGLHYDASVDKDTAFDAHLTFIQGVLGELNEGKTDALKDLGFNATTPEQLQVVKAEFEQYQKDAIQMRDIYNTVKVKYNKNFVPEITQDHFQLAKLQEEKDGVDKAILQHQANMSQYGSLTSQGREIHDIEYKLQALKEEQTRLADLHRETESVQEKNNISKLIDDNQQKITDTVNKINEINADDTYTSSQKIADNDIIGASLKNQEYGQAIYDREHLDNEIALQRKNVALWNTKEYAEEKIQKAIKNAKTKQQVQQAAANTTSTTIQEQAKEKETQIAANEAAQVINQQNNPINNNDVLGIGSSVGWDGEKRVVKAINGDVVDFEDGTKAHLNDITQSFEYQKQQNKGQTFNDDSLVAGNEFLNTIKEAVVPPAPPQAKQDTGNPIGTIDGTETEVLFSPTDYDFNNSSQEAKDKVKNGVGGLINQLGVNNIFFEDLVRHVIKLQGLTTADNLYNALQYGWEANGKESENYEAVYAKIFGNPLDELMQGASQLVIKTKEELVAATAEVEIDVTTPKDKDIEFDNNNQPIKRNYTGIITNESSPKAAYSTRLTRLIRKENEDGTVDISYEVDQDNFNTISKWIDSNILLDPDDANEGTETIIRIPLDYNDIPITVYKGDGSYDKTITFGQYVAENNLKPEDQLYKDKIPMVHYFKDSAKHKANGEKGIFFVHDVQWYSGDRFNEEFQDDMKKAITSTREIRQEVIDDKGEGTAATLTGKRQTTFNGLKTAKDQTISLMEANPQAQLTIALTPDTLNRNKSSTVFPNNNTKLTNTKFNWTKGQIIEVRRFGLENGIETYIALPVIRKKIDEAIKTSIVQVVTAYATKASPKSITIQKSILDTMAIDIFSPQGLEQYLAHFISINAVKVRTNQGDNLTAVVAVAAKNQLALGTPYIVVEKGQVIFGQAGVNQTTSTVAYFINPKAPDSTIGLTALASKAVTVNGTKYSSILGWYETNLDLTALLGNKPVVTIGSNGTPTINSNYEDFVKEKLQTNIRSHNIGTAEKPNYVTNIQPVVTYDTNKRLAKQTTPLTNTEVREEIVQETKVETQETTTEIKVDPLELARLAIEKAKAKLGVDFKNNNDRGDNMFSPAELSDTQTQQVANSVNRMAGLTPAQQFDLTDFMYNQVTAMVNLETKVVTQADVDKQVDAAFKEVIEPHKQQIKELLVHAEKLVEDFPELKDHEIADTIISYKHRLAKIQAIQDNMAILKEEAFNRVAKYTGITQGKVKFEAKEGLEETLEEEANDREVDFWTDILTESPENKLTYSMRRFFGQVRNVDKSGNFISGFLGLPTYVGADNITKHLMVTLADVPSDFDTMIAKLETRKVGLPWMQQVIDKLKAANQEKQNQFVTVMSNTMLRMKFTMISFNRRTGAWTTKMYDTNSSGTANALRDEWESGFIDSDLVTVDEEKNYILNKTKAESLIKTFQGWKGMNVLEIPKELVEPLWQNTISNVTNNTSIDFNPTGALLQLLKTNIVSKGDRMKFSLKNSNFQVTAIGNGKYKIEFFKQTVADKNQAANWLAEFGIIVSDETMDELYNKGLYHNYGQRRWNELFDTGNTNGIFGILYNKLVDLANRENQPLFNEEGGKPLDDSVLSSLATLEAKYNASVSAIGFRDGKKSIYAISAPKFMTDRVRDLKTVDSEVVNQLRQISFSNPSLWLQLLSNDKFREKFNISHMGLTAFKELGKKNYRDNSINALSDIDHELTKLGMFWDTTQGELESTVKNYIGTNVAMRMATMFSPTMSDKQMMTLITTAVLDLRNKDLRNGEGISDEVAKILYEQTVKPELARMIKFHQNGGATNISGYDKGAAMFLLLPTLNNLMYDADNKLVDVIKHQPNIFTLQELEKNEELMKAIYSEVKKYTDTLAKEKLAVWETNGLITKTTVNDVTNTELKFFDNKYIGDSRLQGNESQKASMAAYDFVVNSMIANANSFMTLAGDPALYYKSKSKDPIQQAKDTFVNVGKRLANQIAPGTTLANSEHEKYIQLFIADRVSTSETIDYLERLLGKKEAASYRKIEGADAQEYTTWQEHLNILSKLGKVADEMMDITPEEIAEARVILSEGKDLTDKQSKLINKVMQPIKPVYTGQIYDKAQDVMRTVYIKSSSFPLIPQITKGFEIDKLRLAMEKMEKDRNMPVRASYQTANKVGSINTPATIWDENGNFIDNTTKIINTEDIISYEGTKRAAQFDRANNVIKVNRKLLKEKFEQKAWTNPRKLIEILHGTQIESYAQALPEDQFKTYKEWEDFVINHEYAHSIYSREQFNNDVPNGTKGQYETVINNMALDKNVNYNSQDPYANSILILDRKNFRIQQEVPFKSGKRSEDTITLGTQIMKLLFGDEILNYDGFQFKGEPHTGKKLHSIYNKTFIKLVQNKQRGLFTELGLDSKGNPIDVQKSLEKLQSILKDEATKRGYPLQDIEGLKLNTDGTFNLPLWSASSSNRYESMLNSIVTNRVIRMKFPGNSYVVGSEEGFRKVKKEEGDLSKDEKSGIVYTSAWNGTHLTGSYDKDGNLIKAQVFVASKFRDNDGKLIDLMTKENGQYKYLEEKDGSLFLKEDMFDKDLMALTSFRIPSSGHQSGSQIEIAGFLPHIAADLMIVPKDFTKQKGLDFDVDKENTYQYWHYQTQDSKFKVLSEEHRSEILTRAEHEKTSNKKLQELLGKLKQERIDGAGPIAIQKIKNDILAALAGQKLIGGLLGDVEYTEEDIEDAGLSKLNAKIDEKILQNEIVAIHQSVFSNPAIQHKIVKTLNTDYAEAEADFIESLTIGEDNEYWTPLSDEYQKGKMALGSAGKVGTGSYSTDVVGHSLFQQAALQGEALGLVEFIQEKGDNSPKMEKKIWRFGNNKSTGFLGGTKTLDGNRTISDVMAERQNIAVDNEKLQIMGKVNLNDLTLDVDKVFNMLGFDKGEDGHSISMLFLSQPIIKEYVAEMKNASSNMATFEKNKEERIIERLLAKYDVDNTLGELDLSEQMSNANLIQGIKDKGANGQLQAAILKRFAEMKAYGIAIRTIQSTINTDSKGLGKSFFDVIEKKTALNKLASTTGLVQGATNLIGDYVFKEEGVEYGEDYIDIGNYMVKPTTLSGVFNIMGVTSAYNLWSKYFPYDAGVTQMVFDEILPIISTGEVGDTKRIELKQEIFKNMRKYFSAFKRNGIIQQTDDINEERRRLFIDSDENTSLASYLKAIKNMQASNDVSPEVKKQIAAVNQFIKTNKLLNRFEFDIQKDGQPSKIKYNNAAGEEFDEQYLYEALASMIGMGKIQLPTVGNKSYTLDTLAQDLIAYAMLGNSIQEAIQFTKYVPVSYLDAVGYSGIMRGVHSNLNNNPALLGFRRSEEQRNKKTDRHLVSHFTMQYIQHNPERVNFKLDVKNVSNVIREANYSDKGILNLQSFKLKEGNGNSPFIAIYNSAIPKGEKKQQLYWFDGIKYNKIPVLGTFGMDEYQPSFDKNEIGQSLINGRTRVTKIETQSEIGNTQTTNEADLFNINSGDIGTVLSNISKANISGLSELATALQPFVNNGIKIQYAEAVGNDTVFRGLYTSSTDTISIHPLYNKDDNSSELARTILHELVHGLTVKQIQPYIISKEDGSVEVKPNAPAHVSNLIRLYNDVRSKVDTTDLQSILQRVKNNGKITQEEKATKYGLVSIYEFMSMALTEPTFQQYLAKTEFKQSGQSLLDKFKEVISSIFNSLGVKFDSNTAAAQAINSIFEFIEVENKSFDDINSELWNDAMSGFEEDTSFLDHIDNELKDNIKPEYVFNTEQEATLGVKDNNIKTGTVIKIKEKGYNGLFRVVNPENDSIEFIRIDEAQFSPLTFPNKKLTIKNEKCI